MKRLLDPVPWAVFLLVTTVVLGMLTSFDARIRRSDESKEQVLVELSQIQTDLKNLDLRLTEIRADVKAIK